MKKISISLMLLCSIIFQSYVHAQIYGTGSKIMVESGDLSFLKDQKELNIEYKYDGMAVGKFKTEAEYIKQKVKEYNQKEAGKGDKWLAGWKSARQERYAPKFEELLNKVLSKPEVVAKQKAPSKYTLIVKTTFTEPGYNIGIAKYPAFVNLDYIFVETADSNKVVAKLYVQNLMGAQAMGFDFDSGSRISESYAKGGKMLGKYLVDNVYKKKK
jgi:hypothetical protein